MVTIWKILFSFSLYFWKGKRVDPENNSIIACTWIHIHILSSFFSIWYFGMNTRMQCTLIQIKPIPCHQHTRHRLTSVTMLSHFTWDRMHGQFSPFWVQCIPRCTILWLISSIWELLAMEIFISFIKSSILWIVSLSPFFVIFLCWVKYSFLSSFFLFYFWQPTMSNLSILSFNKPCYQTSQISNPPVLLKMLLTLMLKPCQNSLGLQGLRFCCINFQTYILWSWYII